MKRVEGDPGTFSHCGDRRPHHPHTHSFAMNEGTYNDIPCNGNGKYLQRSQAENDHAVANLDPDSFVAKVLKAPKPEELPIPRQCTDPNPHRPHTYSVTYAGTVFSHVICDGKSDPAKARGKAHPEMFTLITDQGEAPAMDEETDHDETQHLKNQVTDLTKFLELKRERLDSYLGTLPSSQSLTPHNIGEIASISRDAESLQRSLNQAWTQYLTHLVNRIPAENRSKAAAMLMGLTEIEEEFGNE